jgi:riboflavin kinase/FMN adenylyltransferase
METIFLNQVRKTSAACVATVGMFDGVHRGHQHVIGQVVEKARKAGVSSTVITFDKVPRQVLDPSFRPQLLTTLEEKKTIIRQLGVDVLAVLPFTRETAVLSAQAFMKQVLHEQLQTKVLVTGYDNRFGHDRTEGFDDYVRYGRELGIEVIRNTAFELEGVNVSSSVIRSFLLEGEVAMAARCLGYPYFLSGKVMPGVQEGRKLGFPTANIEVPVEKLIPASGAYAVDARRKDTVTMMPAMMNVGTRPTFGENNQTLEVHILDFEGDIYGKELLVAFEHRLRGERKFKSAEDLASQLRKDAERVREMISEK